MGTAYPGQAGILYPWPLLNPRGKFSYRESCCPHKIEPSLEITAVASGLTLSERSEHDTEPRETWVLGSAPDPVYKSLNLP